MTNFFRLLTIFLLASTIASAKVVEPTPSPIRFNPGGIMTTANWNATVPGIYTWINTNIVNTLNKLTAKGDMYVYDGSALQKLASGTNTYVLVARASSALGVAWEAYTGEDPRTTKGDITYYDGSGHVNRLPVGADGTVLTLIDGLPSWTSNVSNPFPVGSIVSWSPVAAGTSTIPAGWTLCDGSNNSPNLIGLFVIGTKPNGSPSSPSPGGFGAYTANTTHGSTTHIHSALVTLDQTNAADVLIVRQGTGASTGSLQHVHAVGTFSRTINSSSSQPADYALCYIMKL